jgi:glucose/arabinose dehydrogenase
MTRRVGQGWISIVVAGALVAGCGNQSPTPTPSSAPSASATAATTQPASGILDPARLRLALEEVVEVPGGPLAVVNAGDGSRRLFVVSQTGQIWVVKGGRRTARPFLDVAGQVTTGGERGLLGLAFHPQYPDDPRFFIDYTDARGNTVVSQWRVSSNPDRASAGSEKALVHVDQPFANHNGGALQFGPDGDLYISLGDGGSEGDPQGNGQRLDTDLAKILRIDVDHPSGNRAYGIPADNPFVDREGARPEIWLTGLRNPWRMSFDRQTGDLWIGDVGQNSYEEIDVVRAGSGGGQNFGWNVMEGFHCYPSGDPCDQQGLTPPVTEYSHADGACSVTGGYVYRGQAHPQMRGAYVFADYCSGQVWAIDATATEVHDPPVVLESGRAISSFGEDENGELYVTDLGGLLLRVAAGS